MRFLRFWGVPVAIGVFAALVRLTLDPSPGIELPILVFGLAFVAVSVRRDIRQERRRREADLRRVLDEFPIVQL